MPEQENARVLSIEKDPENRPPILVIDDLIVEEGYAGAIWTAHELLGRLIADFTYTSTIRCWHDGLEDEDLKTAISRCSVWTHSLLDNRLVILATQRGLIQMGVKMREEGEMFRSGKYGLVLCIPPLWSMNEIDRTPYKAKTARLLKEAGLL
jgi:hypothetical protein